MVCVYGNECYRPHYVSNPIYISKIGDCNIALLSYAHGGTWLSVSASKWSDVVVQAYKLISTCAISDRQGGAAVIDSKASFTTRVDRDLIPEELICE